MDKCFSMQKEAIDGGYRYTKMCADEWYCERTMLHATTLMSQNTVTWNAMLDVVLTISVMGLRVVYLVEAHCGWY